MMVTPILVETAEKVVPTRVVIGSNLAMDNKSTTWWLIMSLVDVRG